jgi:hypothetical protein
MPNETHGLNPLIYMRDWSMLNIKNIKCVYVLCYLAFTHTCVSRGNKISLPMWVKIRIEAHQLIIKINSLSVA